MPIGLGDRAAAKIVGVSHTAIGKAKETGRLPTLSDGSVSREALDKWNSERPPSRGGTPTKVSTQVAILPGETAEQAAGRIAAANGIPDHDRAEAERRKANFDALLKQLEYVIKAKSVLPWEVQVKAWGSRVAQLRTRALSIPSEAAPALFRCKTVAELQDLLMALIVEALEGLASDRPPAAD